MLRIVAADAVAVVTGVNRKKNSERKRSFSE
jgi:hypothetical protein